MNESEKARKRGAAVTDKHRMQPEVKPRRPRYWLHFTTGLTIDRRLSAVAKLRAAITAAVPGRDPSMRSLALAFGVETKTVTRAGRELERFGLARILRRRRLVLHLLGLARPANQGRQRYVMMSPELFYASVDAVSGRGRLEAPLVVQRLLREQWKRGATHISPAVIAADVDLKPARVVTLLGSRPVKWCTRLSASSSLDVYAAVAIAITSSGSSTGSVSAFAIDSALM